MKSWQWRRRRRSRGVTQRTMLCVPCAHIFQHFMFRTRNETEEKKIAEESSSSLGHVIAMHLIHDALTFFDFILCSLCAHADRRGETVGYAGARWCTRATNKLRCFLSECQSIGAKKKLIEIFVHNLALWRGRHFVIRHAGRVRCSCGFACASMLIACYQCSDASVARMKRKKERERGEQKSSKITPKNKTQSWKFVGFIIVYWNIRNMCSCALYSNVLHLNHGFRVRYRIIKNAYTQSLGSITSIFPYSSSSSLFAFFIGSCHWRRVPQ